MAHMDCIKCELKSSGVISTLGPVILVVSWSSDMISTPLRNVVFDQHFILLFNDLG